MDVVAVAVTVERLLRYERASWQMLMLLQKEPMAVARSSWVSHVKLMSAVQEVE
jgi:hypothetical protein